MHVKIANIGHKFRLIQIESDIRSVQGKNEIIDPDALLDMEQADLSKAAPAAAAAPVVDDESDELLRSLGM